MYTSQMIVNGRRAFVGSDARTEKVRIKEALDQPAPLQINLAVSAGPKDNEILVRYTVSNRPNETMTNIALVGKESAKTSVSGGENAGRTLQQHHVVRSFKSTLLDGEKEQAMLTMLESLTSNEVSVIAYVQHQKTMAILGAAAIEQIGKS